VPLRQSDSVIQRDCLTPKSQCIAYAAGRPRCHRTRRSGRANGGRSTRAERYTLAQSRAIRFRTHAVTVCRSCARVRAERRRATYALFFFSGECSAQDPLRSSAMDSSVDASASRGARGPAAQHARTRVTRIQSPRAPRFLHEKRGGTEPFAGTIDSMGAHDGACEEFSSTWSSVRSGQSLRGRVSIGRSAEPGTRSLPPVRAPDEVKAALEARGRSRPLRRLEMDALKGEE